MLNFYCVMFPFENEDGFISADKERYHCCLDSHVMKSLYGISYSVSVALK
jgi:hypothetical protein